MEKNLNPLYYLEEAIGGAGARRIVKSAKKHKIDIDRITRSLINKGDGKSYAADARLRAKYLGNIARGDGGESGIGRRAMEQTRGFMKQIQKRGSELDKKIAHRRPGDFVKQFKKDKAKKSNQFKIDEIKRLKKEKAQKGKDLLDSLL